MDYTVELIQEIKQKLIELEILVSIRGCNKVNTPQKEQNKTHYNPMTTEELFELQKQVYNKVKNDNSNGKNTK